MSRGTDRWEKEMKDKKFIIELFALLACAASCIDVVIIGC